MKKKTPNTITLLTGKNLIDSALPVRMINSLGEPIGSTQAALLKHDWHACRKPLIALPGAGRPKFPLPSVEQLIAVCVQHINQRAAEQRAAAQAQAAAKTAGRKKAGEAKPEGKSEETQGINEILGGTLPPIQNVVPTVLSASANGSTLWAAAGGMADMMYDGRFEAHLANIFDEPQGVEEWARKHMPAKFQKTVESLRFHWEEIYKLFVGDRDLRRNQIGGALPAVMHAVQANFPGASEDEVIEAAVRVVCNALQQIMNILQLWDSSFKQQRDGKYSELLYVTNTLEQCFQLFTADGIKTMVMHVGDVFMPRYSEGGPATRPGSRGPLNSHLVDVPYYMRRTLVINMPIFTHEFRHDIYADIPGLPDQMAKAIIEAIQKNKDKFKFTSDTISLGGQKVSTLDLITQIYVQTLSETDADIAGGVLLTGRAFMTSMIVVFSALNTMGTSIFNANATLRSSSRYGIDDSSGQPELVVAPHMPDFARAHVGAAALDVLGFKDHANEIRALADQAGGESRPKFITWSNSDPNDKRFKFKIQVPFEDLIQVAYTVAHAIIHTKLECLGNRSTGELVYFDSHKQEKVDRLTALLLAGQSDVPADMGDVYATYVCAAAITAYWQMTKSGVQPRRAADQVETLSRKMMDEVHRRWLEAEKAKADAAAQIAAAVEALEKEKNPGGDQPK